MFSWQMVVGRLLAPKTSDFCSAMRIAENHLLDAMFFTAFYGVAAETHCDAGHDAASLQVRCHDVVNFQGQTSAE